MRSFVLVCLSLCLSPLQAQSENVILITLDGARTQEIFGGLDTTLVRSKLKKNQKLEDHALYKRYWAETPEARRSKLMPFFWGELVTKHGSIAGNRERGSPCELTNKRRFSYPGYSEILTGKARDSQIRSNDKIQNPNPTVLEFLKRKLELEKKQVASFASWDVFDWIVESKKGAITSNAGYEAFDFPDSKIRTLSAQQFETPTPWDSVRHDLYTFRFAMAHLKTHKPRVLYLALGETDDWGHDNRYDRVLEALERTDKYLKELWDFVQSDEQYRGKTSILITTDHGRGDTPKDWTDHGANVEGAQYVWFAFVSPQCPKRGEWTNAPTLRTDQVAATLCRFVDLDYKEQEADCGEVMREIFEN